MKGLASFWKSLPCFCISHHKARVLSCFLLSSFSHLNYFLPRYQKILSEIVFLKFHVSLFSHFSCTGNYYVLLSGMDFRVCFSLYITGLISICYKTVFSFLTCGTHFIINCFHIWWVCFWALFCSVNIVYAYVVTTQS